MGEHADDILNGDVDEQTGEWIGGGQGFPRTLQRPSRVKTPQTKLFGVKNYMKNRGVIGAGVTQAMRGFIRHIEPDSDSSLDMVPNVDMAVKISSNWVPFTSWFGNNFKKYVTQANVPREENQPPQQD